MPTKLFAVVPNPPQVSAGLGAPLTPTGGRPLRDWQFDFARGDLTRTADGRAVEVRHPELVVAQHCTVNLLIEKDSYRVYPRRFGIDYERAQHLRLRHQTQADIESQVRDQLRRVRGVRDVIEPRWEWPTPDSAHLRFIVTMRAGLPRRAMKALIPMPMGGSRG